ncbi:MAG TPA: PilZ domain-containing protein [Pseudolabrys sp.]
MDIKFDDAPDVTREERRKAARHRTLKAGHIRFNRSGSIDCRVRNLSPAGACLEVTSQLGIPDDFTLVIDVDHLTRTCHVIWRTATRLGVAFNG